jgi:hypothetical protein
MSGLRASPVRAGWREVVGWQPCLMARYRSAWTTACCCACLVGDCLAVVMSSAGSVLLVFALSAGTCALTRYCLAWDCSSGRSFRDGFRGTIASSALVGMVSVAVIAWAVTVPVAAMIGCALACLTSPVCVTWLSARLSASDDGGDARVAHQRQMWSVAVRSAAAGLTDSELCRAWVASFGLLESVPDSAALERVVVLRQCYLDELERRDPAALAAWLHSGARASSSPGRYLGGP